MHIQAWLQTQSGRNGRAICSTLSKGSASTQHMVSMWALRAEMAFLVNNLLYYLQCDVLDARFQALRDVINTSDSFETIRSAHSRFVDRILLDCLTYNKLTWTTVNTLLRIALTFARRMCVDCAHAPHPACVHFGSRVCVCVCVCVFAYTHTHTHTGAYPSKWRRG